jgi:hypothetical protein
MTIEHDRLVETHNTLRFDLWSLLLTSRAIPAHSHVSNYTNKDLIEHLRKALQGDTK